MADKRLSAAWCDNFDLGGKPNSDEDKANLEEAGDLSLAISGQSQDPVLRVTLYGVF